MIGVWDSASRIFDLRQSGTMQSPNNPVQRSVHIKRTRPIVVLALGSAALRRRCGVPPLNGDVVQYPDSSSSLATN